MVRYRDQVGAPSNPADDGLSWYSGLPPFDWTAGSRHTVFSEPAGRARNDGLPVSAHVVSSATIDWASITKHGEESHDARTKNDFLHQP